MKLMSAILSVALVLSACGPRQDEGESTLKVGGRTVGGFKGFETFQTAITSRILEADAGVDLENILGPSLNLLLGSFSGELTNSQLEAVLPNPVNVLLWEILVDKAAEEISSRVCAGEPSIRESFQQVAAPLCPEGKADASLEELWLTVMRYEAPPEEKDAWIAAMSEMSLEVPEERLKVLLQSLFLHPYFLLEH